MSLEVLAKVASKGYIVLRGPKILFVCLFVAPIRVVHPGTHQSGTVSVYSTGTPRLL